MSQVDHRGQQGVQNKWNTYNPLPKRTMTIYQETMVISQIDGPPVTGESIDSKTDYGNYMRFSKMNIPEFN